MTKAGELRELTDETLVDRLGEAKQELWKSRLDLATGQLDNTSDIGKHKREIARLSTLMRQREIEAAEAAKEAE
jgi:large subunit ribosomal protein L29